MASKDLTDRQKQALLAAEDTLFGDVKLGEGWGRQVRGLRIRELVEGDLPHVYLTAAGKAEKARLHV